MKHIITATLILLAPILSYADEWSAHIISIHPGQSGMNDINPGVSYAHDNFRVGAVYNSYKKVSVYGMTTVTFYKRLHLGIGVITGYEDLYDEKIIPAIAIEYETTDSLSIIWFGLAFNMKVTL